MARDFPEQILLSVGEPIELEAAEGESEEPRGFKMLAYTGGLLPEYVTSFGQPVVVDLEGMRVPGRSRPVLRDHDPGRIIGHTSNISIEGGRVRVSGVVSAANEYAAEVEASSRRGFPWQASIGAKIERAAYLDAGETAVVNGRTFKGPIIIARRSSLREVSFVALGADNNTRAKVAASASTSHTGVHSMEFEKWLEAKGFGADVELNDEQRDSLKAMFEAEVEAANAPAPIPDPAPAVPPVEPPLDVDVAAQMREAASTELERQDAIRAICDRYGNPTMEDGRTVRAAAIAENWTAERTELQALRDDRSRVPAIHAGGNQPENAGQVMEVALLLASGMAEQTIAAIGRDYDEQTINAAMGRDYRSASLHMLMDQCLRAAGKHYGGSRSSDGYITAVFEADAMLRASSAFSTTAVSNVLENVANKTLLAAYNSVNVVWPSICAVRSHGDFKAHSRYRLDTKGAFKKVAADGELKHIELADAKYQATLDTYGAMIALTRQMMINDDLGAFLRIPSSLGRLSNLRVEEAVFVTLLDNSDNFFHSNNNNIQTGAGSDLTIAGLNLAVRTFDEQVDSNGKPILLTPKILLCGLQDRETAHALFKETSVMVSTTADTRQFSHNPHVGLFVPKPTGYLNNTNITDQDGAALSNQDTDQWYLFADPADRAALVVGFLNGRQVPVIESAQTSFNTLGIQWRAYLDFVAGKEDPVGAVKMDGA